MGKVEGDRGGKHIYNRVTPWHCFINIDNVKKYNIKYHDENKMKNSFTTDCIYDVGSTFLEDVKNHGLKVGNVNLSGSYYIHFEGMSWYKNKYDPFRKDTGIDFGGTHNNYAYVEAHDIKKNEFKEFDLKFMWCVEFQFRVSDYSKIRCANNSHSFIWLSEISAGRRYSSLPAPGLFFPPCSE